MKLYIISPNDKGEGMYALIAETGEYLFSHYCSNEFFAHCDLIGRREERKEMLKSLYGEYEVIFFNKQNKISIKELFEKNREWFEKLSNVDKNVS